MGYRYVWAIDELTSNKVHGPDATPAGDHSDQQARTPPLATVTPWLSSRLCKSNEHNYD